jgi:adenine deaminase
MDATIIKANVVDVLQKQVFFGEIYFANAKIVSISPLGSPLAGAPFALPGFVDAHVHVESSLLVPSQFARLAVVHGTVATVSDPHEIANVCGLQGVEYMIAEGKTVPFKFYFGAPSCVPATGFETAGAAVGVDEVQQLLARPEVKYLSEMMNFPGVLGHDPEVMAKIAAAKAAYKPIDGHAPGLRGAQAQQYIDAGIGTDHECFTYEEALDKLQRGMKILIREGSAAKNFDALAPLLHHWHHQMMFCSDDKHPDSLLEGHINQLCARAVALGIDVFKVLEAACVNPVRHYGLEVGLLQPGDAADFVVVNDLADFKVVQTFISGALVAQQGSSRLMAPVAPVINRFEAAPIHAADLAMPDTGADAVAAIGALDRQLITERLQVKPLIINGLLQSDVQEDLLKIVVVNRYHAAPIAKALVKNFGLKRGALASSVAHDSHNIVAIGTDDHSLASAINLVIAERGGLAACDDADQQLVLGLPVAGLMTNADGYAVAKAYARLDQFAKQALGSTLQSPFMTLSFMALLVIPHLKLSDKGLFDGDAFALVGGN